jgi:hypothetical protein
VCQDRSRKQTLRVNKEDAGVVDRLYIAGMYGTGSIRNIRGPEVSITTSK